MNFVQPIRDLETIGEIEIFLKDKRERDYILFLLGIYTGLRVSDILRLKVSDLKDKSYLVIRETKTRKQKRIKIHTYLKKHLKPYLKEKDPEEYVIKSRKGKNKPITRQSAYLILREVASHFNLDAIGTHTLRKTFGYHFYKQTKDVALLQELFNHAAPTITLRYIGINQDTMDDAMMKFSYK
jgi:integrase